MKEKTINQIKAIIRDNLENDRATYAGLSSNEIAQYSRLLMFGENPEMPSSLDEAYEWDRNWSSWVD